MTERQRAEQLRDQVLKTWNPPLGGMGRPVDVAQTSVMQTLAFVFGEDFFPALTFEQAAALNGGLALMRSVFQKTETESVDKPKCG